MEKGTGQRHVGKNVLQILRRIQQLLEVDPRFNTHLIEHEDNILRRDIARGPRGKGTPSQPADGCVKNPYPGFISLEGIGESQPPRIV